MAVYAAKEATTSGYPPSDWPLLWSWPGAPWPPGWPKDIEDDDDYPYSVDVTAPSNLYRGEAATTEIEILASDTTSTDGLAGHRLKVTAKIGSTVVNVKKLTGDDYSTAIYYNIENYSGSQYGISEDIFFEVEPSDGGEELTITGEVTSVTPDLSGTDTVTVSECTFEFTNQPTTVTRNVAFTISIKITNGNDVTQSDLAPETTLTLNDAGASDELSDSLIETGDWSEGTYTDATMTISGGSETYLTSTIVASSETYSSDTTDQFPVSEGMYRLATVTDSSSLTYGDYPIYYDSSYVYVAKRVPGGRLSATNVTEPGLMVVDGYKENVMGYPRAIVANGIFAYSYGLRGHARFQRVNVSSKENMVLAAEIVAGDIQFPHNGTSQMAISGDYVMMSCVDNFPATAGRLVAVDAPVGGGISVESYLNDATLLTIRGMAVSGNNLFASIDAGTPLLCSIDISNKSSMSLTDSLVLTGASTVRWVSIYSDYAYIIDSGSSLLHIVDISTPASLSYVKSVEIPLAPYGMVITGGKLILSTNSGGSDFPISRIRKYDLANPETPDLEETLDLYGVTNICTDGTYLYAHGGGDTEYANGIASIYLAI